MWASFNDGSGWGEPVLLEGGNGNIGSFSAVFTKDGTLHVSVSERGIVEEYTLSAAAKLREYIVTPLCDLSLESAHAWTDGTSTQVTAFAANRGQQDLNGFDLQLLDENDTVIASISDFSLAAGTSEFIFFDLNTAYAQNTVLMVRAIAPESLKENLSSNNETLALVNSNEISSEFSFSTSYLETDAGIKIIAKQSNFPTAVGTCTVYGAIYDANGKMLAVAAEFCGSANDGTYACQLLLPVAVPAGGTVMVFLLDSELAPLTESTYLFP